jgi:UDP-3-O-[3-hydroxymyristoyl] N-acetylglucosamine deacetylase
MQTTLRETVRFDGVGLHTGAESSIEIRPAPRDFGLAFLLDGVHVPATAEYIVKTSRATAIGSEGHNVWTIEHVLSALLGMGITNAELSVVGPEVPIVDGSAKAFADAIEAAGIESQHGSRATLVVTEPFELRQGDRALILLPSPQLRVRFIADFPAPIGTQYFDGVIEPELYRKEIAPARTFGYLHEIDALRESGLARGGTLENALVFAPDGAMQPLHWPNEVVRHKVLDLLGDLALLGAWPQCDVIAVKSGHSLHAAATRALRERYRDAVAVHSA